MMHGRQRYLGSNMFILTLQHWNPVTRTLPEVGGLTEICCDSQHIYNTLALVEAHPNIRAYQIANTIGKFTKKSLAYYYPGYVYPGGKAVSKFNWKVLKKELKKKRR